MLTLTNHGAAIPLPETEPLLEPDEQNGRQCVYYACRLNRRDPEPIVSLVTPHRVTRTELNALYDSIVAAWS